MDKQESEKKCCYCVPDPGIKCCCCCNTGCMPIDFFCGWLCMPCAILAIRAAMNAQ